jgi:hypothetical protein
MKKDERITTFNLLISETTLIKIQIPGRFNPCRGI